MNKFYEDSIRDCPYFCGKEIRNDIRRGIQTKKIYF